MLPHSGKGSVDAPPVKAGEAALVRILALVCLVVLFWQIGSAAEGAYRAYRYRLVWGDKLIS